MPVINRTLAIVTLKKPFVDWLNSLPDRGDIDWEEAAKETAPTILLPDEDRMTLSKDYAECMISYAMGGRAAEELVFGHQTTGAGDDIEKATEIARKMVCNWGMSEVIGPVAVGKRNEEVFLGRDMAMHTSGSQRLAEQVDQEIHRIVTTSYSRAVELLKKCRPVLDEMAETLLIKEVLDSTEIDRIIKGEKVLSEQEKKEYLEAEAKRATARQAPTSNKSSSETVSVGGGRLEPIPGT
mgnify:CR=1 FL=1